MKRIIPHALALGLLLLPLFVLAQDSGTGKGFVPLTQIEAIEYVGNEGNSLADFLNSIYRICIGLAAVIGVLQLMRAGLTWMTAGGSHEKIGQARNLIRDTLIGLLLVLAPTIVFSIINPSILSLDIKGLDKLKVPESSSSQPPPPGTETANPTGDVLSNTRVGGEFFYKFTSYSEAQTDTYISQCKVVPASVDTLIASRKATKRAETAPGNAPAGKEYATLYTVLCESTSKSFGEYMLYRGYQTIADWKPFPKFGSPFSQLKDGCAANGGALRTSTNSERVCREDEMEIIRADIVAGGGDPERIFAKCKTTAYTCENPK